MQTDDGRRTALVVGASRGLGLALAETYLGRGWHVIATERKPGEKLRVLRAGAPDRLEIETLDITADDQIAALRRRLAQRSLDLLFVNAGISNGRGEVLPDISNDDFLRVMATNALGPMRVLEALQDLVSPQGALAVMSSGLGSVANNTGGGWESYRASKAALNTLMRSFAARHPGDPRAMLLIAPGWVRTDMGGPSASLSVDESIPLVADTIEANAGKPGLRFLDRFGEAVPW